MLRLIFLTSGDFEFPTWINEIEHLGRMYCLKEMQETYDKTDEDATDAADASGEDPDQGGNSIAKKFVWETTLILALEKLKNCLS